MLPPDIADRQPHAFIRQLPAQVPADMAQALDDDPQPVQAVAAQPVIDGGPDAHEDAARRGGRRIAAAAFLQAGDMPGDAPDDRHVLDRSSDILGDDVASGQPVDGTPHGRYQFGGLLLARIADDHRFAAAEGQVGERVLIRHAARQAQRILHGLIFARISPHATTAQGWAAGGVVNGDDGFQTGFRVRCEHDLFVTIEVLLRKY